MKHVKMLSTERPAKADEMSWIPLKNIIAPFKLTAQQARWLLAGINNWLTT